MQQLGHPILGDHLYANDEIYGCVPHLYLHAALLRFRHPSTEKEMSFCAPAPFPVPEHHVPEVAWLDEDLSTQITSTLDTAQPMTYLPADDDAKSDEGQQTETDSTDSSAS